MTIAGHEVDHPIIVRIFMIGLHDPEDDHVRPKILLAVIQMHRSKITIRPLTGQNGFYPEFRFFQQSLVFQGIRHITIPTQPVRYFFPTPFASIFQPGVVSFLQPSANLPQMTAKSVLL